MADVGQSKFIGYGITFADSIGGAGTTVGVAAIPGTGDNSGIDCGGADNAQITVDFLEADLRPAKSDSYSDTITLLVAPI